MIAVGYDPLSGQVMVTFGDDVIFQSYVIMK
jgi:hypothetical protein